MENIFDIDLIFDPTENLQEKIVTYRSNLKAEKRHTLYIDQPVRKDNLHDQTPYKYLLDTLLYVYQQQGTGDTVKKKL